MSDEKHNPNQASTLQPWQKISEQINSLDNALKTIPGYTEESALTRMYIVGQIEALKWASRLWDSV